MICMYSNIDGINAIKGSELSMIIKEDDPEIVFVVETKLKDDEVTSQYPDCGGYRVYRKDRTGPGGGVLLMVKEEIETKEMMQTSEIEAVGCEMIIAKSMIPLLCVYRPPNSPEDCNKKIRDLMLKVSTFNSRQVLICGDFNYGEIQWVKNRGGGKSSCSFLDVCQDCFLHQHVTKFAHCRGSDKPLLVMSHN